METNEPDLEDNFYLELSTEPVKFESVSSSTNVFFDDSKQQVRFFSFISFQQLKILL